jgi:hypothetical protein
MPSLEDMTVEQLLAHAKSTESSHTLLQSLTQNPETREGIQRLLKKANPKLVIPEIDAADRVMGSVKELREDNEKLRREIQEKEIRRDIESRKAKVMSDYSLTEADMSGVEKLMLDAENPIPTYDAAARVYLASKQSATPTPAQWTAPTTYEMPEKDVWGPGIGNKAKLDRIAMNEAFKAASEVFSGKVPGLGGARAN